MYVDTGPAVGGLTTPSHTFTDDWMLPLALLATVAGPGTGSLTEGCFDPTCLALSSCDLVEASFFGSWLTVQLSNYVYNGVGLLDLQH